VLKIMQGTDALTYTAKLAQDYAEKAKACLSVLPDTEYRNVLSDLADYSVSRTF